MQLSAGKIWGMRRMADADGFFKMTAVDQRPPIKEPIARHYGAKEAPYKDVAAFKSLLVETLQDQSSAMLLDPHFAIPAGLHRMSPTKGLIVTLEDSQFEETGAGRVSSAIDDWSVEKIKRMGADAVKVLTWYRPDASPSVIQAQKDFSRRIGEQCARYDIPYLLELLVYPLAGDQHQTSDYVEMQAKKTDHVLASIEEFAKPEYGVDVFKLESPINAADVPGVGADGWEEVQAVFEQMGKLAGRPWVMLSAGASKTAFRNVLRQAYRAGASGFLAGRAIWLDAFAHFPDFDRIRHNLMTEGVAYVRDINAMTEAHAMPWHRHGCYSGPAMQLVPPDGSFRHSYRGFEKS